MRSPEITRPADAQTSQCDGLAESDFLGGLAGVCYGLFIPKTSTIKERLTGSVSWLHLRVVGC